MKWPIRTGIVYTFEPAYPALQQLRKKVHRAPVGFVGKKTRPRAGSNRRYLGSLHTHLDVYVITAERRNHWTTETRWRSDPRLWHYEQGTNCGSEEAFKLPLSLRLSFYLLYSMVLTYNLWARRHISVFSRSIRSIFQTEKLPERSRSASSDNWMKTASRHGRLIG